MKAREPDAPHDTAAGMERLMHFARRGEWKLLESTRVKALALGVDISGVQFAKGGE